MLQRLQGGNLLAIRWLAESRGWQGGDRPNSRDAHRETIRTIPRRGSGLNRSKALGIEGF